MARRSLVYLLCFASGLAGLTYEVIWLRLFAVSLGNAAFATSAVLASVMAGMGLGALVLGRWADRRDPLILYGGLEVALGLAALALPTAAALAGELALPLLRAAGPGALGVLVRFAVASSVLLVPACLMGATVPVLVRFARDAGGALGASAGTIYALNTGGAALGAALAGHLLLARLGVSATNTLAALIDLGVGLGALALGAWQRWPESGSRGSPVVIDGAIRVAVVPTTLAPSRGAAAGAEGRTARAALLAAFVSGLVVLSLEGLWTRLLTLAAGHDVYAFASMLAATLAALALGAALYRATPARLRASAHALPLLLTALSVLALLALGLAGHAFLARGVDVLGLEARLVVTRSHELSMIAHGLFALILVVPPGLAAGALFPAACAAYEGPGVGARVGRVLAVNTAGSIVGAFLGPLVLVPALGLDGALVLVATLPALLAAGLAASAAGSPRAQHALPLVLAALAGLALPGDLPRRMLARKIGPAHLTFALYEEGATATVAVVENLLHPERTLYLNGINEVTTRLVHDESFSLLGHLGPLLHPAPRRVLVVCLGGGLSAGAAARHASIESMTIVDLEPSVALATRRFEDLNHGVLDDPRVRLVFDDGRNHLRTTAAQYDVMVVDSTHPRAVDSWILYTREMYETARARLAEGGWIVQWVPLHGLSVDEWRILTRTFLEVFPSASLFVNAGYEPYGHSGYGLLVGQRGEGRFDVATLERALAAPAVQDDLARWGLAGVGEILECFVGGPAALRRWTEGAPINTDDRPITQFVSAYSEAAPMDVDRMLEVLEPVGPQLTREPSPALARELERRLAARGLLLGGHLARAAEVCGEGCAKYAGYRAALARGPAYYRRLAAAYPRDADRLLETGASLLELGRLAEGERVLEQATRVAPREPQLFLSLGLARAAAGDDLAAIEAFSEALSLAPEHVLARVGLGLALAREGRGAEGVSVLSRALAREPSLAEVHAALGHVLALEPGEQARARTHLRRALALDPRSLSARVSLARLYLAEGRARAAVAELERGRAFHPHDPDLVYTLGVAYARAGRSREARAALEHALLLDPEDAPARAALEELEEASNDAAHGRQ